MCLAVFPLIVSQILVGIPVKLCASTVSALTNPAGLVAFRLQVVLQQHSAMSVWPV